MNIGKLKVVLCKFLVVSLLFTTNKAKSQSQTIKSLQIGDKTENLVLTLLKNYPSISVKIEHFRGKLLILDFWSTGCSSCIAAIPKMEALQQQFKDSIQIILVNPWESAEKIEERTRLMNSYRPGVGISSLPMANGDKIWRILFPHQTVPHHVWIDGTGKVIAITNGENTTIENIAKTLKGNAPTLSVKHELKAYGYDAWKEGFFKNAHPSLNIPFQSGFVRYNPGFGSGNSSFTDTTSQIYHRIWLNSSILSLFQSAYTVKGKRNRTIVEATDTTLFNTSIKQIDSEEYHKKNLYSYQISLPLHEKKNINKHVQQDLNRFFSYEKGIVGEMESKTFPCLVLTAKKKSLLKSAGGKLSYKIHKDSLVFFNTPFPNVFSALQGKLEDLSKPIALIDETGITISVDMVLTGDLNNKENLRKQLAHYGIGLKEKKRQLEILVIKDRPSDL